VTRPRRRVEKCYIPGRPTWSLFGDLIPLRSKHRAVPSIGIEAWKVHDPLDTCGCTRGVGSAFGLVIEFDGVPLLGSFATGGIPLLYSLATVVVPLLASLATVTVPCQDVRFSNFLIAFDRPWASYAARSPGLKCIPKELIPALTPEPGLERSERGEEDEVGMERGEKRGDDAEVVELDLA